MSSQQPDAQPEVQSEGRPATARPSAVTEMPEELRADVRLLGELLGQVIAEDGGPELLADVERLRKAVIAARRQEISVEEVAAMVAAWPVNRAVQIARAFTCYFHLVNLAEEHFRIRVLRRRDTAEAPLPESLAQAVQELSEHLDGEELQALVDGLEYRPVLTAHPTEARRRAVVTAIQRISAQLDLYNSPGRGSAEREEFRRRLLEEIDLLWRTAQLRSTPLDPLDEVRTAMAMFDETLFRTVPQIYRSLETALGGDGTRPPRARPYIRYGSWIGGDRDGNPNVTAKVTREAIQIQAQHVLIALENATTRIGRSLTVAASSAPPSADLRGAIARALDDHPDLVSELATRSPQEPHRQWLLFVAARIAATRRRDLDLAYLSPGDLLDDLRLCQVSLAEAGAVRQAYGELQHLIWQVETFGFHLAELEIRQHSQVHATALAELAAGGPLSERTEEVLATFRVIAWIQERFGVTACSRYVVSFTRSAADIAAVHELARHALGHRAPVLDVVPLFESGEDLDNAPTVLSGMLELEAVQHRLATNGRRLEVMLGYSDSAKELGPAAATLKLYDAQAALAAWARENDIRLTMFHGRGGALGRGGGPANRAVLAQAPGSVDGRFKVTEQGEVIFARYGHSQIARRHIEQVTNAVLLASTPQVAARAADAAARFRRLAERVAAASEKAYRMLTEAPGFPEWFSLVSPLEEIGSLRIGSRPPRRGLGAPRSLDDLRAIPWVFAWAQTRVNLPGWYGLGSGLAAAMAEEGGLDELRQAYAEWPLFASLLDNAEMSLAKTDRAIAERYLALGGREDFTTEVLAEYDLTRRLVLTVTGHSRLLENRRVLSRAVQLRDPYVDALSHLQLRALSALRADPDMPQIDRERLSTLLLLSVNGVAAGLQNTG